MPAAEPPGAAWDWTREALVTEEAHHPGGRADVEAEVEDLENLLEWLAGGVCRSTVLNAERGKFDVA